MIKKLFSFAVGLFLLLPLNCSAGWVEDNYQIIMSGKSNFALDFDGSDDYVSITKGSDVDISGNTKFSWEFTFAADSDGGGNEGRIYQKPDHAIVTLSETVDGVSLHAGIDFGAGTNASATTDGKLSVGVKYHCVVVFNEDSDNKIKIYVNGVLQSLGTDTAGIGTIDDDTDNDMLLGAQNTTGLRVYDGKLYEFRVYPGTALTAAQALSLSGGASVTGFTAHWPIDEGRGTTLYDRVGGNDGTISGATWTRVEK